MTGNAIEKGSHPGYTEYYVQYLTSYLYSIQGSIEYETMSPNRGYHLFLDVKNIRKQYARPNEAEDQKWIAAADGNIAAALRANGRAEEALDLYLELLQREDTSANLDIYLSNTCLCLFLSERFDEALGYSVEALNTARKMRGSESEQVAQSVFASFTQ